MYRRTIFYLFFCTVIFLASCGSTNSVDKSAREDAVDNSGEKMDGIEDFQQIIKPNNKLGFLLIDKVEQNERGNIFISPTSALMALLMAYNGADGKTKAEIAKALHIDGVAVDNLNRANASLMERLNKNSEAIQVSIANSLWINKDFHFTDKYAEDVITYFQAEVTEIDVADNASVDKMNHWVRKATNDKITEIVKAPLDSRMVAMLINALYFEGKWKYEFNEANTEDLPFYTSEAEKDVPMMSLEEELEYIENDEFQAVKLPYGKGEMSMSIFLPNEDSNIDSLMDQLTEENWEAWNREFKEKRGTITLPKFQIEYETILNESLKQLGMELAFKKEADFSKMINEDDPLWIHEVKQKTYIDVDEEGTEAAAVTSVEMRTEMAIIEDTFHMEVNRPFFIAITDEESGIILFMGAISNL